MRRIILLVGLVVMVAAPAMALDAYPKTSIAEDVTATWCGYCPDAYAGLDVVHSNFDYSEFVSARYYATSGDYGTPETDGRIAFYGIGSYPTVIFNGTENIVGGGDGIASGGPYMAIVQGAYFMPAPIRIEVLSFDSDTGAVSADVTMYSTTEPLDNDRILFLLLENDVLVADNHTHVVRDIIDLPITLADAGNSVNFSETFDMDPGWNPDKLWAAVFVQLDDPSKEILQAATSYPLPDYKIRAMVPFSRVQIGPSTGIFEGDDFTLMNVGTSNDTFTIDIVVDSGPGTWSPEFCDEGGTCYPGPFEFDLDVDSSTAFNVKLTPDSPGYMEYHFEVTSPNLSEPLTIGFTYFTDDLESIVVDDDGVEDYETYITEALDSLGITYGVWNRAGSPLTAEAAQFPVLFWATGEAYPTLDAADQAFLAPYLDDGGRLFLTGQDIGWDLVDNGVGPAFYRDYLHAVFVSDDTNNYILDGVEGDPVSDGLMLQIQGGDGANNQAYPSQISPYDIYGSEILWYQTGTPKAGAIKVAHCPTDARIVYLAFGYEAIDNPQDRAALLGPAIDWLWSWDPFIDGFDYSGDGSVWSGMVQ